MDIEHKPPSAPPSPDYFPTDCSAELSSGSEDDPEIKRLASIREANTTDTTVNAGVEIVLRSGTKKRKKITKISSTQKKTFNATQKKSFNANKKTKKKKKRLEVDEVFILLLFVFIKISCITINFSYT